MLLKPIDPIVAELVDLLNPALRDAWAEKSAVVEYDAGKSRAHAEAIALLCIIDSYPDALRGVTVFQVDVDDEPHWFVTTSQELARVHIAKVGGTERQLADVASVIEVNFGGLAEITAAA